MRVPPVTEEKLGYRFDVGGEVIEIVGSEGVRRDPKTLGRFTTRRAMSVAPSRRTAC